MKTIRIEKRIPFGFRGDWGLLYKKYHFDEANAKSVVTWQKATYYDIGMNVQFKPVDDGVAHQSTPSQTKENLVAKGDYRIVQTTDAYFNESRGEFECVAEIGDIVKVFGRFWVVDAIDEKCVYAPVKQSFYDISLKRITDRVVEEQK